MNAQPQHLELALIGSLSHPKPVMISLSTSNILVKRNQRWDEGDRDDRVGFRVTPTTLFAKMAAKAHLKGKKQFKTNTLPPKTLSCYFAIS